VLCLLSTKPQSDFAAAGSVTQSITASKFHFPTVQIVFQDAHLATLVSCYDCTINTASDKQSVVNVIINILLLCR
jgi:hypothetical protein